MVQATPSKDGLHFVTGGNREIYGPLSYVYSVESGNWTTTPTLPGLATSIGYKRFNVGMALDKVTGLVYMYGGLQEASFSREIAVLDTSSPDATKMTWTLATNSTLPMLPTLYDPSAVFLPTRNKTLVFGGCEHFNSTSGLVSDCYPLNGGFLISNGQSEARLSIERQLLNTPVIPPSPRYLSCRVVLPDGNVFIQGGKTRDNNQDFYFADAWILNVTDWTWKSVSITGPEVEMTRAGHACQLGAYGQIVIVGGSIKTNGVDSYVTPDVAVIDTGSWRWQTRYTGGPLNCIWPSSCPPVPGLGGDTGSPNNNNNNNNNDNNNNNNNSNDNNESSGLSAGAKGGIGAGVVLAILAVGGFIFWKRYRSSSPSTPHDQKPDAPSSRLQGSGDAFETNEAGFSRTINTPRGPAYISPSQPTVQTVYIPPPPPQAIVESQEPASPAMTTPPLYTRYGNATSDEIASMPSPVVSKKHSLFGITNSSSKSNLGGTNSNGNGDAGSDAALAAALLLAEDSSSSRNPSSRKGTFSDNKDHIAFQQMTVNHIRVPSAKSSQQKPQPDSSESSSTSSAASSPDNRPPTIHTFVKNTIQPSAATPRHLAGPQSLVPEEEARIQRFSPGVPVQTVTAQDLNQDGHYPPLTPTRGYGSSSILIGSSGPATPTTLVTSPLHHSTIMAYPDLIAMGAQPLPGHPAAIEGGTRAPGYFGQPAYSHSGSATTTNIDSNDSGDGNGSPLYRDPQMAKDLDQIAREIKSQSLQEPPKGPHALVRSSLRKP
ncbi:hypothetical protein BGZ88_007744 [Linnemannia elongata]|nr:hypothetical protein BGZ88_007744 [Linnemannia elongata]